MDTNSVHQHAASQTSDDHTFAKDINAQHQIAMTMICFILLVIPCWLFAVTVILEPLPDGAGVVPDENVGGLPENKMVPIVVVHSLAASDAAVAQSGTEQGAFVTVAQTGTQSSRRLTYLVEHTVTQTS